VRDADFLVHAESAKVPGAFLPVSGRGAVRAIICGQLAIPDILPVFGKSRVHSPWMEYLASII